MSSSQDKPEGNDTAELTAALLLHVVGHLIHAEDVSVKGELLFEEFCQPVDLLLKYRLSHRQCKIFHCQLKDVSCNRIFVSQYDSGFLQGPPTVSLNCFVRLFKEPVFILDFDELML